MHKSGKCLALSGTEGLPPVPNKADDAHRDYQNMRKLRSNRRRPRREAAPVPTAPPPSGGSPNHRAGGSPRGAREALTLQRLLRLLRLLCLLWIKFRRAPFGAFCVFCVFCVFCGSISNATALAGHSFTLFETITENT